MILSRRLDVLNLKAGSEYLKYFKGLDALLEINEEEKKGFYTDTYCIDSSWVPLYLIVYKPMKDGIKIVYSGENSEVVNKHALNEAKDVLENFIKNTYAKVSYVK